MHGYFVIAKGGGFDYSMSSVLLLVSSVTANGLIFAVGGNLEQCLCTGDTVASLLSSMIQPRTHGCVFVQH